MQVERKLGDRNMYMVLVSDFWKYPLLAIIMVITTVALVLCWNKYWPTHGQRLLQWIVWRINAELTRAYEIYSAKLSIDLKDDDIGRNFGRSLWSSYCILCSTVFKIKRHSIMEYKGMNLAPLCALINVLLQRPNWSQIVTAKLD